MTIAAIVSLLAFASLLVATLIYGTLTSWWKTRTGVGFFSMMVAFTVKMAVTVADVLYDVPFWMWLFSWGLIIITVNFGIVWNIIYKQFIQKRSNLLPNAKTHRKEDHVGANR